MPPPGHKTAPPFPENPSHMPHWFEVIEYLGIEHRQTDEGVIRAATLYAGMEGTVWKELPSYSGQSFGAFKEEVLKMYPGSIPSYTLADLDRLVDEQPAEGHSDRTALSKYLRDYRLIAGHLRAKRVIGDLEYNRFYAKGFKGEMGRQLNFRFTIRDPANHGPDVVYTVEDVYAMAEAVLVKGGIPTLGTAQTSGSTVKQTRFDSPRVEDLGQKLDSLIAVMQTAFSTPQTNMRPPYQNLPRVAAAAATAATAATAGTAFSPSPFANRCIYCGDGSHRISFCPVANEDIAKGLVIRNEAQRLVLPNGMELGRSLPGVSFAEKVKLYHEHQAVRETPPHIASGSANLFEVSSYLYVPDAKTDTRAPSNAYKEEASKPTTGPSQVFVATRSKHSGPFQRIPAFDDENHQARNGKRHTPKQQQPGGPDDDNDDDSDDEFADASSDAGGGSDRDHGHDDDDDDNGGHNRSHSHGADRGHDHDIGAGPAATGRPPPASPLAPASPRAPAQGAHRAVGTSGVPRPADPLVVSDPSPQFRYRTPVEESGDIKVVADQLLDAPITISGRDLLAVSPGCRKALRDAVTPRRLPAQAATGPAPLSVPSSASNPAPALAPTHSAEALISVPTFSATPLADAKSTSPSDYSIRSTPVNLELTRETAPNCLPVSQLPAALPNGVIVEAVLDTGSALIAMRRDVWERTQTPLRPDWKLAVTSANSDQSFSLGLGSQMPITVGGITTLHNVHVVERAPFELLLGVPFFAATRATLGFTARGEQTLTMVDPETEERFMAVGRPHVSKSRDEPAAGVSADFS